MYLLVGIPGYVIVGDDMQPNVLQAIPNNWMSTAVNFLITFHLMMACIIIFNPVAQDIEGIFQIPDSKLINRFIHALTVNCPSSHISYTFRILF